MRQQKTEPRKISWTGELGGGGQGDGGDGVTAGETADVMGR